MIIDKLPWVDHGGEFHLVACKLPQSIAWLLLVCETVLLSNTVTYSLSGHDSMPFIACSMLLTHQKGNVSGLLQGTES